MPLPWLCCCREVVYDNSSYNHVRRLLDDICAVISRAHEDDDGAAAANVLFACVLDERGEAMCVIEHTQDARSNARALLLRVPALVRAASQHASRHMSSASVPSLHVRGDRVGLSIFCAGGASAVVLYEFPSGDGWINSAAIDAGVAPLAAMLHTAVLQLLVHVGELPPGAVGAGAVVGVPLATAL